MKIQPKLIAIAFLLLSLTACSNTVDGLGKDMESNGQAIQRQF